MAPPHSFVEAQLATGGQTGALAASIDWASHPLGPPEQWPPTLKTTLGILFHSNHPMFLWWGPELFQFYNDGYLPSFGKGKHPQAMGQRGRDCWPETWPIIGPQIEGVMSEGKATWNENQLVPILRNGRLEDVYWTYGYSPVYGAHNEVVGTLVVCTETTREVLSRKQADRSRARLDNLFQNAPAFVCSLRGPTHIFEMANPAYRRMIGANRVLIERPVIEAVPEVIGQGFIEMLDGVYNTGVAFVGNETAMSIDRLGNGQLDQAAVTFVYQPRFDIHGKVEGIDVFGFEVTEQARARQRIEALLAEAKLADDRKNEFLAMLAHELRTPLAAISLALSMLERTAAKPEAGAKFRLTAGRQVTALVRLVDGLLDVSRITRGAIELRKQPVDLNAIVANAVATVREAVERDQRTLSVDVAAANYALIGDPTRLEQVVTNLLTNAAKYTPAGGAVHVSLTREDSRAAAPMAVLRIRDNGRGIPREMLGQIFEIFVQVRPDVDRKLGGLGLGLTLVHRLVELHGGTVDALSEGPDRGSEFVVRLPLSVGVSEPAAPPPSIAPPGNATSPPGNATSTKDGLRVLLVEDSEDVREPMAALLELLGHDVSIAVDGPSALEKLLALKADLALVDVGLPGIDGYEVARRARAAGVSKTLLVALTGYSGPEAKAKAEAAGFDLHLTKPLKPDDLSKALARAKSPRECP
jgi:signal transduction histidine kinase/CheY-like chemotaxis protein